MAKTLIKLENLIIFIISLYFYNKTGVSWIFFGLLFLTPDFSLLGYLKNKKWGAYIYNAIHNYILSAIIILGGLVINEFVLAYGIILTAHVGLDRFFGFGLKYTADSKTTHIQKL